MERSFDYAHELFTQCVLQDADNLTMVQTMLANLRAKFGGDKKKVRRGLGFGNGRALKKAIGRNDWQEALRLGIEQLKTDPWHVPTLHVLADASAALHHNEVELAYLKQALQASPKDAEVNRHCARSLARMGQFDQAIACWHRVEKLQPSNKEPKEMISKLMQDKLHWASTPHEITSHVSPSVVPEPKATDEPKTQQRHEIVLSARERLEQAQSLHREQSRQPTPGPKHWKPIRIPWLEMVLAAAMCLLVLQLVPQWGTAVLQFAADNSRMLLFASNVLFVGIALLLRYWHQRTMQSME